MLLQGMKVWFVADSEDDAAAKAFGAEALQKGFRPAAEGELPRPVPLTGTGPLSEQELYDSSYIGGMWKPKVFPEP